MPKRKKSKSKHSSFGNFYLKLHVWQKIFFLIIAFSLVSAYESGDEQESDSNNEEPMSESEESSGSEASSSDSETKIQEDANSLGEDAAKKRSRENSLEHKNDSNEIVDEDDMIHINRKDLDIKEDSNQHAAVNEPKVNLDSLHRKSPTQSGEATPINSLYSMSINLFLFKLTHSMNLFSLSSRERISARL